MIECMEEQAPFETLIPPGEHLLPGAYLENCVAPFAFVSAEDDKPPSVPERIKAAMWGKGWQTIKQIADGSGLSDTSVRTCLAKVLQPDEKVEKTEGPHSTRGPAAMLWRWRARGRVQRVCFIDVTCTMCFSSPPLSLSAAGGQCGSSRLRGCGSQSVSSFPLRRTELCGESK